LVNRGRDVGLPQVRLVRVDPSSLHEIQSFMVTVFPSLAATTLVRLTDRGSAAGAPLTGRTRPRPPHPIWPGDVRTASRGASPQQQPQVRRPTMGHGRGRGSVRAHPESAARRR
jgi:hypothetical protein